ncbi:hypothetical protein BSZ39_03960 [Bowdeniella nasicola]|uniref:Division initiation protein n=1 Tax=Bowdeniella nasicola TaxID=208480 RepID=A0A1Q5Q3R3_9ACTO|nr:DUF881 domain-containing protein [Bowdeniella nasicola]OKL54463.1 hypothetical protein BSZ39_03960 [Bowdeniella nasicola]
MATESEKSLSSRLSVLWRARSITVMVLCVLLGIGVITQVRQEPTKNLAAMRQDDLIRLLDELGRRNDELTTEAQVLEQRLAELQSGAKSSQAAREAAQEQVRNRSILAGTVPVHGPGITLTIIDNDSVITAQMMVTVLEELRNAGAEAIELNSRRLTTSSWFVREGTTLIVDGESISSPYVFNAIGGAQTMSGALDIPGGALATIRTAGARSTVTQRDDIFITAVRQEPELKHAKPQDKS